MAYTTIDNPELYFQVKLWTGTGSSNALTLDGDTDMQPDLVWIKERGGTSNHNLTDAVRLATNYLVPNQPDAEATAAETLKSFDSDGFTVGTSGGVNGSSQTYVAWCWKESAVSGMDIVSYTGSGSARTISHSLSAVPRMIIAKDREDGALNWFVGHTSAGWTKRLKLDGTQGADDNTVWNNTDPTSSVFSVGSSSNANQDGNGIIAYCFAEKQGFSKISSYTGNGNADGAFVYTGFRPAFVMIRQTNAAGENWFICDNKRAGYNEENNRLMPNITAVEQTDSPIDILSNGFKARETGAKVNASGGTYIYMCFAESPLVNSNGVPCNAR